MAASAVLLMVVAPMAGADAEEKGDESVSFTFAPPDGTTYVQTTETVRELASPDGKRHVDRTESKAKVDIRRTPRGFVITTTPIAMTMSRDGASIKDPALDILDDTAVKYVVSPRGQLERVEGFEDVARRIRESYPPEVAVAVERLLGPGTLAARVQAEWKGRIGDFAGRSFPIGKAWDSGAAFTFPNGRHLDYFIRTEIVGRTPCTGGSCVEVRFRYDSDPRALGALSARVPDAGDGSGGEVRATLAALAGAGTRVIDPKTMLVYSERIVRTMKVQTDLPDGSVPVVTREEQRISISEVSRTRAAD
jgi:hypothetical protein